MKIEHMSKQCLAFVLRLFVFFFFDLFCCVFFWMWFYRIPFETDEKTPPFFQRFFDGLWMVLGLSSIYCTFLHGFIPVFIRFLLTAKLGLKAYEKTWPGFIPVLKIDRKEKPI